MWYRIRVELQGDVLLPYCSRRKNGLDMMLELHNTGTRQKWCSQARWYLAPTLLKFDMGSCSTSQKLCSEF